MQPSFWSFVEDDFAWLFVYIFAYIFYYYFLNYNLIFNWTLLLHRSPCNRFNSNERGIYCTGPRFWLSVVESITYQVSYTKLISRSPFIRIKFIACVPVILWKGWQNPRGTKPQSKKNKPNGQNPSHIWRRWTKPQSMRKKLKGKKPSHFFMN